MTLRLNGSTSGYTEIDAPAAAGNNTLKLPTGNGTADQVIATNGSGDLSFVDRGRMVLETAKASTSGTSVNFTGIPSWVKRVTVMFDGVSTSGTSSILIQLGDSGGIENTGYVGGGARFGTAALAAAAYTAGFGINIAAAADTYNGSLIASLLTGNTWAAQGNFGGSATSPMFVVGGSKTLSATLTRLRITTVNGTDTFDAGSINILYEG